MCANSDSSGETARTCRLAWAFASRLCDKYHNLMSWWAGSVTLSPVSFQIMLRPLFTAVTVLSAASMPHASPLPGGKQYGVVLDAGSSSTKVHVYSLEKVPGKIPKVEEIFYSKVKPGISGFEDNVNEITTYISQIMTAITEAVPAPSVTPVYFMATAGKFTCV